MCNLHIVIWLASMKNDIACETKQNINIVNCCDNCWSIKNYWYVYSKEISLSGYLALEAETMTKLACGENNFGHLRKSEKS